MPILVEISDTQGHLPIDKAGLTELVERVLIEEDAPRASISIAFVDNATIRQLNCRHLGHDWPTDVISFPLSTADDSILVGELVVSAEMAVALAPDVGAEAREELALYVVHGLLHLCGYDDASEVSAQVMRRREREILDGAAADRATEPRPPRSC